MLLTMIGRRGFLRVGLLAGLYGLAGCSPLEARPVLRAAPETLPKKWRRLLPSPWRFKKLEINNEGKDFFTTAFDSGNDLLAVGDGWLSTLPKNELQPIGSSAPYDRLNSQARNFLISLGPELGKKVFPVGVTPWVLLFRRGEQWISKAKLDWQVLLDPRLKGRLVLPESPRIVMSLAQTIDVENALGRLRKQAFTFDDRNAMNWVLSGDARVAVLPLQRCFPALKHDPRLSVVLPEVGAPLHWILLARPIKTREPIPRQWLEKAWKFPLLDQLLASGWIPPITQEELQKSVKSLPELYKSVLPPPQKILQKCWSLTPLTISKEEALIERWTRSVP